MKDYYIQAPLEHHDIMTIKCKAKRIKPARKKDVPKEYHRHPIQNFKDKLYYAKQDIKFIIKLLKSEV